MRAQETVQQTGLNVTGAAFQLIGGLYSFACTATFGGGSVGLDILLPDGVTWSSAITPRTTQGFQTGIYLPPGQYRFALVTATNANVFVSRIPGD